MSGSCKRGQESLAQNAATIDPVSMGQSEGLVAGVAAAGTYCQGPADGPILQAAAFGALFFAIAFPSGHGLACARGLLAAVAARVMGVALAASGCRASQIGGEGSSWRYSCRVHEMRRTRAVDFPLGECPYLVCLEVSAAGIAADIGNIAEKFSVLKLNTLLI